VITPSPTSSRNDRINHKRDLKTTRTISVSKTNPTPLQALQKDKTNLFPKSLLQLRGTAEHKEISITIDLTVRTADSTIERAENFFY
jgi:hypothetical protein